tara:strand:+ start:1239 stop:1454 length:216 start_codon:yes stop_codon:yes gene_type:complete
MIIIAFLLFIAFTFIIVGHFKNGEIIISPIKGIMFGFLYHKEQYEEDDEFTLQCLLGVISINVIWINQHNG